MNGRRIAGAAVVLSLAALVAAPLALERSVLTTDPEIARSLIGLLGSALAIVVVAWIGWAVLPGDESRDAAPSELVSSPPERGDHRTDGLVGDGLREDVDRAARLRARGVASSAEQSVWRELRTAAAVAERHASGVATDRARERVAAGEWTDDRVAAAFLASQEADVAYPLGHVVYEWLTPAGAFRRRVEHAADAIYERYETGEPAAAGDDRIPAPNPVSPDEAPDVPTALLGPDLADVVRSAADDGLVALPTNDEGDVKNGLRTAAAAAVSGTADGSARELVRSGEWTDDRVAAAFLADHAADVSPPLLQAAYERADPRGALDRSVARTARAILARCENLSLEEVTSSAHVGRAGGRAPADEPGGRDGDDALTDPGDGAIPRDADDPGREPGVSSDFGGFPPGDETIGRGPAVAPGADGDGGTKRRTSITEDNR